jgi:hypothetical protein
MLKDPKHHPLVGLGKAKPSFSGCYEGKREKTPHLVAW